MILSEKNRRGEYGFDEPVWPLLLGFLGVIFLLFGLMSTVFGAFSILSVICFVCALFSLLSTASYVYTTRWGKFQVWADILRQLGLRGDEHLLDLGCGRGAVLLMAAHFLERGKATGIDVWKEAEQSGNAIEVTERNAQREGVAERVALRTADMQHLPFSNNSFDLVVSSMAIHNIPIASGRRQAIHEAVRVLKPGGKLVIVDFRETRHYEDYLRALGIETITHHPLGWRIWYVGPWTAPQLVKAQKPL